jgi:colicin import membrane protein
MRVGGTLGDPERPSSGARSRATSLRGHSRGVVQRPDRREPCVLQGNRPPGPTIRRPPHSAASPTIGADGRVAAAVWSDRADADRWHRLEALFDQAMACADDERSSLLAQACDGDPELHRELAAMLASAPTAGASLRRAAAAEVRLIASDGVATQVGRRIGRVAATLLAATIVSLRQAGRADEQAAAAEAAKADAIHALTRAQTEADRARKAEARVQAQLDQLRAAQAAREAAEAEARAKRSEAELNRAQLSEALVTARQHKQQAEQEAARERQAQARADQEAVKAREAENRAASAVSAEELTRQKLHQAAEQERQRAEQAEKHRKEIASELR